MTDVEIKLGLKKGNHQAYEFLYEHYYSFLCTYAHSFIKDKDSAEHIVNDIIFSIWNTRESLTIESSLKVYLIGAVKNRCLNFIKQRSNQSRLKDELLVHYSFLSDENALERLFIQDLQKEIDRTLADMPPLTREIFSKSRYENLTYKEIAEELGISVDVVKYHVKSALSILRVSLKDYLLLLFFIKYF